MGSLRRYTAAGAVFAWPLNGGEPLQEARDRHVVTGAPGVVNSPYGRALSFDGANDYVTLGAAWEDQLRFDVGTDDFSVVAWVRRVGASAAFKAIIDKRDANGDGWIFFISNVDGLYFRINNSTAANSVGTIDDGEWHCVIASVDRSVGYQLYLDGVPDGFGASAAAAMATTTAPRIGAVSYDASSKFGGEIAGLFVIPRVLSPAECLGIATGRAF